MKDIVHTGSDDAGRTVAAGILAPGLTFAPSHAATAVLGVPGILDVVPQQLGGIQILLFLGAVVQAEHRQANPLLIVVEIVEIAVTSLFLDALVPLIKQVAIAGTTSTQIGINHHIHGMSLRPILVLLGVGHIGHRVEIALATVPEVSY